mmetsp:Transcript_53831/g.156996  ORF Transcript_53831/g.156996 Transcript_53831/m.156996 type:complete len:273 (-) Transcript_53831:187-1005(-)
MVETASRSRLLRRQQSMDAHRVHFDAIIKGSMQDLQSAFEGVVGSYIKDASGRDLALEMLMTRFASDLQRSVDRFSHTQLEETWAKFDANRDGSLQKQEMRKVVSSLLSAIHQNLPKMVQSAMEPAAENLNEWIESDAYGPMGMHHSGGMNIALHANVQARVQAASGKLKQLLDLLMQGLLKESDAISDEIFDTIDANKDGKVVKGEFSDAFAEAFGAVIDFSKITREVLRQRSSLKRSKSVVDSSDSMVLGAGLFVLAAASAAFILFKRRH